jgi:hypothetical protein
MRLVPAAVATAPALVSSIRLHVPGGVLLEVADSAVPAQWVAAVVRELLR